MICTHSKSFKQLINMERAKEREKKRPTPFQLCGKIKGSCKLASYLPVYFACGEDLRVRRRA